MKYVNEYTKESFNSAKECEKSEKEYLAKQKAEKEKKEKLSAERTKRAKEVEDAYKAIVEAKKNYYTLRNKFVEDYGSYHMSFHSGDSADMKTLFDLIF